MVGRELPNFRPNGEDHRGASGGNMQRTKRGLHTTFGMLLIGGSRRLKAMMTVIHKALVWLLHRVLGFSAIHFNSQG